MVRECHQTLLQPCALVATLLDHRAKQQGTFSPNFDPTICLIVPVLVVSVGAGLHDNENKAITYHKQPKRDAFVKQTARY